MNNYQKLVELQSTRSEVKRFAKILAPACEVLREKLFEILESLDRFLTAGIVLTYDSALSGNGKVVFRCAGGVGVFGQWKPQKTT